jgi:hypothetical protein
MKRVISFLSRFDYEFHHIPGTTNVVADALSRRPDHVPPEGEKPLVTVLPDHLFIRLIRPAQLELEIKRHQEEAKGRQRIKEWQDSHNLERRKRYHWMGSALVVVQPEKVAKRLLEIYHEGPTAGHPGRAKTFRDLMRHYWWPEMRKFV